MKKYIKPTIYIIKTGLYSCLLDASGGGGGGGGDAADANSKGSSLIFDDEDIDYTQNTATNKSIWDD